MPKYMIVTTHLCMRAQQMSKLIFFLEDNINWYYRIFQTIRCTYNSLIFSEMECGPYSLVRLMCTSHCTLSPSSKQILCSNNRYQCNSTSFNLFFLESKVLSFFLAIKLPTFITLASVFFLFTYPCSLHKCIFLFTLCV